jgi:hypothetical protein
LSASEFQHGREDESVFDGRVEVNPQLGEDLLKAEIGAQEVEILGNASNIGKRSSASVFTIREVVLESQDAKFTIGFGAEKIQFESWIITVGGVGEELLEGNEYIYELEEARTADNLELFFSQEAFVFAQFLEFIEAKIASLVLQANDIANESEEKSKLSVNIVFVATVYN